MDRVNNRVYLGSEGKYMCFTEGPLGGKPVRHSHKRIWYSFTENVTKKCAAVHTAKLREWVIIDPKREQQSGVTTWKQWRNVTENLQKSYTRRV